MHRETHGMRDDIDETTPLEDVKAPSVFERAKEEVEALIQTVNKGSSRPNKQGGEIAAHRTEKPDSGSDSEVRTPKFIEKAKETIGKMMHQKKSSHHHQHHKETHGMSDDIDEDTPIDEVKGPSVFERAKEEIEAVFQAIHPKRDS